MCVTNTEDCNPDNMSLSSDSEKDSPHKNTPFVNKEEINRIIVGDKVKVNTLTKGRTLL